VTDAKLRSLSDYDWSRTTMLLFVCGVPFWSWRRNRKKRI